MQNRLFEAIEQKLVYLRLVLRDAKSLQRYDMHRLTMLFYRGVELQAEIQKAQPFSDALNALADDFAHWLKSLNEELGLDPTDGAILI